MKPKNPHTFTSDQSDQLRAHVRDQMKVHTEAALGLGKALFEVYYGTIKETDAPLITAWGHATFEDYAEKELLMHGGTARSYVRVYDELCIRRQFDEGVLPASITALRELSKVSRKLTDQRELQRWVKRAHDLTACEFKTEVENELYGKHGRQRHLGFHMQWATATRCMKRIREARETLGFQTNGEALDRILSDWALGKKTPSEIRALRRTA